MKVLLVGGGKTGSFLLGALSKNNEVVLLEKDASRVGLLRERWPQKDIRHGDGCEPSVLEDAGVKDADVVVAATGDDEDNLVISYLSKYEYGVPMVFAKVNNPRNEWLFNRNWGVDVAVDPAGILASLVEEEVGLGDLVTLLKLQRENVAVEEFTLEEDHPWIGRRFGEVRWPEQVVLAVAFRENALLIPRAEEVFQKGDRLLFVCPLNRQEELRKLLRIGGRGRD